MSSSRAAPKSLTKSELLTDLANKLGQSKAEIGRVLEALAGTVTAELKRGATVTVPGIARLKATHKAATPARPGRNPFTGEAITIKAKPARKALRAAPVKALKDAVA